jgi:hypothetical protein
MRLHDDGDDFHACGVDDVVAGFAADVQFNTFLDD